MARLEDLTALSFAEQMQLLMDVNARQDPQDLPALFDAVAAPLGDAAVDAMVRGALRTLLLAHLDWLPRAFAHSSLSVQRVSVHAAASLDLNAPKSQEALKSLVQLAERHQHHPELLLEALTAMAQMNPRRLLDAGALPVFRMHLLHPDPLIAGVCLTMIGAFQDCGSLPALASLLDTSAQPAERGAESQCEAPLWNAMDALSDLAAADCPGALELLARHMHHPNASARRQAHDALASHGEQVLPLLITALEDADPDMPIMAANLIGRIGHKRGVSALLDALDHGRLDSPTQRFAAFEALGRIPSLTSIVYLLNAWESETDPAGCMALAHAIQDQFVPAMADRLFAPVLAADPSHQERMVRALAATSAPVLLQALHTTPPMHALMLEHLIHHGTPSTLEAHLAWLEALGNHEAARRLATRRDQLTQRALRPRLLAIDDSAAMRSFYLGAGPGVGLEVVVAEDGLQALKLLDAPGKMQCIIVDMNMPVMDGVVFVRHLRSKHGFRHTPVIMATTESTPAQRDQAAQAGVDEFLEKPFTMQALQSTIARLLHT